MTRLAWLASALLAFGLLGTAVATAKEAEPETAAPAADLIDYAAFARLAAEVEPYRAERIVDLEAFNQLAARADALILDARSSEAFAAGHIDGAVNLPFSDFTTAALAEVIGDPDRLVLIYCNNNFINDVAPIMLKRAPLALNIPTFINLYGYGYRNLYELGGALDAADARVRWSGEL